MAAGLSVPNVEIQYDCTSGSLLVNWRGCSKRIRVPGVALRTGRISCYTSVAFCEAYVLSVMVREATAFERMAELDCARDGSCETFYDY